MSRWRGESGRLASVSGGSRLVMVTRMHVIQYRWLWFVHLARFVHTKLVVRFWLELVMFVWAFMHILIFFFFCESQKKKSSTKIGKRGVKYIQQLAKRKKIHIFFVLELFFFWWSAKEEEPNTEKRGGNIFSLLPASGKEIEELHLLSILELFSFVHCQKKRAPWWRRKDDESSC